MAKKEDDSQIDCSAVEAVGGFSNSSGKSDGTNSAGGQERHMAVVAFLSYLFIFD